MRKILKQPLLEVVPLSKVSICQLDALMYSMHFLMSYLEKIPSPMFKVVHIQIHFLSLGSFMWLLA
jgi:hypothetical protein